MSTVLSDDFTSPALRSDLWTVGVATGNPYNYAGYISPSNVVPDRAHGLMHLVASVNPSPPDANHPYLTGVVRSAPFLFGSVEVRARMAKGKGIWPAIWMLTASAVWPPEVDIVEVLGAAPTVGHCTYHYTDPTAGTAQQTSGQFGGVDLSAGFHTYGVVWAPGSLVYTFDGATVMTVADSPAEPMYLLLSMQVGSATSWGGAPDGTTVFPASMDIDWVTIQQ